MLAALETLFYEADTNYAFADEDAGEMAALEFARAAIAAARGEG